MRVFFRTPCISDGIAILRGAPVRLWYNGALIDELPEVDFCNLAHAGN